jgi:hypothetical protein
MQLGRDAVSQKVSRNLLRRAIRGASISEFDLQDMDLLCELHKGQGVGDGTRRPALAVPANQDLVE